MDTKNDVKPNIEGHESKKVSFTEDEKNLIIQLVERYKILTDEILSFKREDIEKRRCAWINVLEEFNNEANQSVELADVKNFYFSYKKSVKAKQPITLPVYTMQTHDELYEHESRSDDAVVAEATQSRGLPGYTVAYVPSQQWAPNGPQRKRGRPKLPAYYPKKNQPPPRHIDGVTGWLVEDGDESEDSEWQSDKERSSDDETERKRSRKRSGKKSTMRDLVARQTDLVHQQIALVKKQSDAYDKLHATLDMFQGLLRANGAVDPATGQPTAYYAVEASDAAQEVDVNNQIVEYDQ